MKVNWWILRTCLAVTAATYAGNMAPTLASEKTQSSAFQLSKDHIAKVREKRRIVVNHPADGLLEAIRSQVSIPDLMEYELGFSDQQGSQIDAQWWCLDQLFPMRTRPMTARNSPLAKGPYMGGNIETIYRWADKDTNIAKVYLEETTRRGLECFYSYRISDGTSYTEFGEKLAESHPDWFTEDEWANKKWDFSRPEVRNLKLRILQELAEDYGFDGLEIDFARGPSNLPVGKQWKHHQALTQFMREIRTITLQVEHQRQKPFLIAARVPDSVIGCHYDGLDVETWIEDHLVDFLVLGVRSYELEIERFRSMIGKNPINIIATLDDHHCTDGYSWPPIEVMRGVVSNWWQQGMDALQTFNWGTAPPHVAARTGMHVRQAYRDDSDRIQVYQQAYRELGSPQTLAYKDKTFVIQRRGGGGSGGAEVNQWETPRFAYQNTNMLAQLPAVLKTDPQIDTFLRLRVGDDVSSDADKITSIAIHVLLSDPTTKSVDSEQKIRKVSINPFWNIPQLFTSPPRKGIQDHVQVRLNGVLLNQPVVQDGWLVCYPDPHLFAVGENLIGVLISDRDPEIPPLTIEKMEVRVVYQRNLNTEGRPKE